MTPANPALRAQLREMARRDGQARDAFGAQCKGLDPESRAALWQPVADIDHHNTAALKAIVDEHGWPGKSLVGVDGAAAAWVLVQHADDDLAFQRDVLARMAQLLGTDELDPSEHAYLYDRVAVADHRPQRFGTQFRPDGQPAPIEDEAHVDDRRAAVGLEPMASYAARMHKLIAATT